MALQTGQKYEQTQCDMNVIVALVAATKLPTITATPILGNFGQLQGALISGSL